MASLKESALFRTRRLERGHCIEHATSRRFPTLDMVDDSERQTIPESEIEPLPGGATIWRFDSREAENLGKCGVPGHWPSQ